LLAFPAAADTLRVATWDVGLTRAAPGLLLADLADPDPQIRAAAEIIRAVRPDVLLLTGIDDDAGGLALDAFRSLIAQGSRGLAYAHAFHAQVNAGDPSFRDLDGDGRTTGWGDAWGWGKFPGHGGMALLSRLPLAEPRTFRLHPWDEGRRLSSRSHWDVPVLLPDGRRLHLLASNPTPPLFGAGNPRRNAAEITFWTSYLSGTPVPDDTGTTAPLPPESPAIVLGNLNLDPVDGAGLHKAIAALLAHPRLQDPRPSSPGGAAAANPHHAGPPELDTADWRDDGGPGNLRTDYVLPTRDLAVVASGVFWPAPGEPLAAAAATASAHRLVWIDITLP
ncbi:endonuclease/exonuclease/phosphatase family protein, partial [uncultured Amaricoccus sp.]